MEQKDVQIQDVWRVEQEILDVIHKVCVENGLKYSLAYGSLIGAVRHGGFIPWDDDIDLMMPRGDYEKLMDIWYDAAPGGYLLQSYHMYDDYPNNFAKIVKDHTTFLQDEKERTKKFHKGIFVDIFPGDRLAPGKVCRKFQYAACAVNLLYSRGFPSGTSGVTGMIERLLLRVPAAKYLKCREISERFVRLWNNKEMQPFVFPCTIRDCKIYYPANMFENTKLISFEGKEYFAVNDVDGMLRVQYGDYMQLPPENERIWKHHPLVIDFEHNYEEMS